MTRRDEAVSSYFFLFVMVWFFYFFSCVSQPFFPRISIVLAINCIALIAMSDFFFSSRLYAFPLCNHIHAKSEWVG